MRATPAAAPRNPRARRARRSNAPGWRAGSIRSSRRPSRSSARRSARAGSEGPSRSTAVSAVFPFSKEDMGATPMLLKSRWRELGDFVGVEGAAVRLEAAVGVAPVLQRGAVAALGEEGTAADFPVAIRMRLVRDGGLKVIR